MASKSVKTKKKVQKKVVKKPVDEEPEEIFVDQEYEMKVTKKEKAQKKRDKNFFYAIGIIVVVLIIIILAGVQIRNYNMNKDTYNHFKFAQRGKLWETLIEKEGVPTFVPFHYHPRELEDFIFEPEIHNKILGFNGTIFITLDPNLNSTIVKAGIQVARITGDRYGILDIPTRSAITNIPEGYEINLSMTPLITCDNATSEIMVIWLKKGIVNSVYSNNNCIVIEGKNEEEIVRGAEKLDYLILGIMQ
ncbi:MAG: hypothetical protein KKG59_04245 [Nanoarchaeota archaeon]|nr:hypothetical protein [Nanoarchaeota archaeon]